MEKPGLGPCMQTLNKVVFIGETAQGSFYVQIQFNLDGKGRLSIQGVEGPRPAKGAAASGGQNQRCLANIITFHPTWNKERVDKLVDVWDKWHLNDVRPYCEHQLRDHGWQLEKPCTVHDFSLTADARKARDALQERILVDCAANGGATVTPNEQEILRRPHCYSYSSPDETPRPGYVLTKTKSTPACQTYRKEHPDGLLCEPCPTCGYKYGSQWRSEAVPSDVIAFLADMEPVHEKSSGARWWRQD
jgi:hypothetical protein